MAWAFAWFLSCRTSWRATSRARPRALELLRRSRRHALAQQLLPALKKLLRPEFSLFAAAGCVGRLPKGEGRPQPAQRFLRPHTLWSGLRRGGSDRIRFLDSARRRGRVGRLLDRPVLEFEGARNHERRQQLTRVQRVQCAVLPEGSKRAFACESPQKTLLCRVELETLRQRRDFFPNHGIPRLVRR